MASRRLLTVFGGKITTYRRLAESALQMLSPFLRHRPGLDRARAAARRQYSLGRSSTRCIAKTRERWPFLSAAHAKRLVHAYGTRIDDILG